jgi:acyl-coenzyme A synthetase/AMP-(fatty) acid ligase
LPKGIARDQYSVVVELLGWCLELQLTAHTSFFMGRPIFYTGGLILVLSTLLAGGTVVLPSDVSWQTYQDTLERRPIDLAFFIPTQLRQFIEEARKAKTGPRFARTILVMGEVISGQEKSDANRLLKSDIIESWGNTEGLGTITRPGDLQDCPDSIGRPFLTDLMFVVDEAGQLLPSGKVGRLAGAVEAGFTEYCGRPDDTRSTKRNDILISDDLGYVDERGMFYVLGRTDEVIEVGEGLAVLPDLESQFRSLGLTKELCMVPLARGPDLTFAVAVVPFDDSAPKQPDEFLEILNQRCPPHIRITEVRFFDALPRTATGKIMRHEVARRFMERPS